MSEGGSRPELGSILVTESLSTQLQQQALRAGVRDVVGAPADATQLAEAIERVAETISAVPSRQLSVAANETWCAWFQRTASRSGVVPSALLVSHFDASPSNAGVNASASIANDADATRRSYSPRRRRSSSVHTPSG